MKRFIITTFLIIFCMAVSGMNIFASPDEIALLENSNSELELLDSSAGETNISVGDDITIIDTTLEDFSAVKEYSNFDIVTWASQRCGYDTQRNIMMVTSANAELLFDSGANKAFSKAEFKITIRDIDSWIIREDLYLTNIIQMSNDGITYQPIAPKLCDEDELTYADGGTTTYRNYNLIYEFPSDVQYVKMSYQYLISGYSVYVHNAVLKGYKRQPLEWDNVNAYCEITDEKVHGNSGYSLKVPANILTEHVITNLSVEGASADKYTLTFYSYPVDKRYINFKIEAKYGFWELYDFNWNYNAKVELQDDGWYKHTYEYKYDVEPYKFYLEIKNTGNNINKDVYIDDITLINSNGENILSNGGFESFLKSNTLASNTYPKYYRFAKWGNCPDDIFKKSFVVQNDLAYDGNNSIVMNADIDGNKGIQCVIYPTLISDGLTGNWTFSFKTDTKLDYYNSGICVSISCNSGNDFWKEVQTLSPVAGPDENGWYTYEMKSTSISDVPTSMFFMVYKINAPIRFDDFKLTVDGDNTNYIMNGSFEETVVSELPPTQRYEITFMDYNGTELAKTTVAEGTKPIYPNAIPTKPADDEYTYEFAGWNPAVVVATADATYTATYTATKNKYIIKFVNEDGTELQSTKVEYGTLPRYDGATPTKEATVEYTYTFDCWSEEITPVTGNKTYIATYITIKNKYTVEFVNEDGTVLQSTEVEYGTLPSYDGLTPTKEATAEYTYSFDGWNEEITPVTGNKTYTAKYIATKNKYTIKFVNENGTVLQSTEVEYGTLPSYDGLTPQKATTAEYKYTFSGWDEEITPVTGNKTYTSTYTATKNKYIVNFVNDDGTVLKSEEMFYGTMPVYAGEPPVKASTVEYHYEFAGWTPEFKHITGTTTYKAKYTAVKNRYIVTFVNEDGTSLQKSELEYGAVPKYTGKSPEKESTAEFTYIFAGWDEEIASVTGDKTYKAIYVASKNKYIVEFVNEDGTVLQSTEVEYGDTPEYTGETPVKDVDSEYSYTFSGWDEEITSVTGHKTYTAKYIATKNKYTIKFVNEDGTVLQNTEVEYGDTPEYTGGTPTKVADDEYTYSFKGWDEKISPVTGHKTYTAKYTATKNKYIIKFVNEDGTELQSTEVEYGTMLSYDGATPQKATTAEYTYTFSGWDEEITSVTGNKTYTAIYTAIKNKYTVAFVNEDGTELQSTEVEYGTMSSYDGATPQKATTAEYTYTFSGWDEEITAVTGNKTYTATYTATKNKYIIKFVNEDCTELQSTEVEYGTMPSYDGATPQKATTAEYKYTFSGWNEEISAVIGNKTYTATYTATKNKYTIKFVNEDGTVLKTEEMLYGTIPVYAGEPPVKTSTVEYHYEFTGWTPEIKSVTGTTTYTATYTATKNKYTIRFVNEDGTVLQSTEVEYGDTPVYTGETPVKEATVEYTYTFDCWSEEITPVTGNKTYIATYIAIKNKYTVEFVNEDGTVLQSTEVEYGDTLEYIGETPVKDADVEYTYTFDCWNEEITPVTGNKTYTATYTAIKNKYLIKFLNEDNTVFFEQTLEYGAEIQLPDEKPYKPLYVFVEWNGYSEDMTVTGNEVFTPVFEYEPNTAEIYGIKEAVVGDKDIEFNIRFKTTYDVPYVNFFVKYPNSLVLKDATSQAFDKLTQNSIETNDEYTIVEYLGIYSFDGLNVPKNDVVDAVKLRFDVSQTALPANVKVELTDDSLMMGDVDYKFVNITNAEVRIQPKVGEFIVINGDDSISSASQFYAQVLPEYTFDKTVYWSVDNDVIATISQDGVLTPHKNGTVVITATLAANSEITASKTINVTSKAKINNLVCNTGYFTEIFNPEIYNYTLIIDEDVKTIELTSAFSMGTLELDGSMLLNGRAKTVNVTDNEMELVLVRSNVSELDDSTYTIKVLKPSAAIKAIYEKTSAGYTFDIKLNKEVINEYENATIILALMDNTKNQIAFSTKSVSSTDVNAQININTEKLSVSYKILLVNSIEKMKPLCINAEGNIN